MKQVSSALMLQCEYCGVLKLVPRRGSRPILYVNVGIFLTVLWYSERILRRAMTTAPRDDE